MENKAEQDSRLLSGPRRPKQQQYMSFADPERPIARFSRTKLVFALTFFVLVVIAILVFAATNKETLLMDNNEPKKVVCPNSPALMHATCSMSFKIRDFMCRDVQEEIERRILGKDNWVDPKSHPGMYELLESTPISTTSGQRTNGDGTNDVDKFTFTYTDQQGQGCFLTGCSVAQSISYYDYSRNYCNMHNLLCGKAENCKIARHDMRPATEEYLKCPYHDVKLCIR